CARITGSPTGPFGDTGLGAGGRYSGSAELARPPCEALYAALASRSRVPSHAAEAKSTTVRPSKLGTPPVPPPLRVSPPVGALTGPGRGGIPGIQRRYPGPPATRWSARGRRARLPRRPSLAQ